MTQLTTPQVLAMARLAGLDLDRDRAKAVAARLAAIVDGLARIPEEALAQAEPAVTFRHPEAAPNA